MYDALEWLLNGIVGFNWFEFIKALASVLTAIIAFKALQNWQRQDKAKREVEFLDALIEAAHTYITEMSKPITIFEIAKISMNSHVPTSEDGDEVEKEIEGAINYIERRGSKDSQSLLNALDAVQSAVIKLKSLVVKGQIFEFSEYAKCQTAIQMLTWHFGRIEAFASVISSPTWNWENPEVRQHLQNVMTIDADEIRESIEENSVIFITFAKDAYKRIYG